MTLQDLITVLNWLIFILIQTTKGASLLSSYRATKIINYHCDPSWKLDSGHAVSLVACAKWCTKEHDCKRFLFCKSSFKCSRFADSNDCVVPGSSDGCHCFQKAIGCDGSTCVCPWGFYGTNCDRIARDCSDAYDNGIRKSKFIVTNVQPVASPKPFEVRCWLSGGGYTSFLERDLTCTGEQFNRSLTEYEAGFGILVNNRWVGFTRLLQMMTSGSSYKMAVFASDGSNTCMTYYENFAISAQSSNYVFTYTRNLISSYFRDCGDSLVGQKGRPFSTHDSDHTSFNCPSRFGGGWWFADQNSCTRSFMMGQATTDNLWLDNTPLDNRPYLSISFSRV